jgi:thioesterase domain-containing protein
VALAPAAPVPAVPPVLTDLDPAERDRRLADLVRAEVAAVLGYADPAEVDVGRRFLELGMDSLTAVQLRNRLAVATGIRLPARLALDEPTPRALTSWLRQALSTVNTVAVGEAGLAVLLRQAADQGEVAEFTDLLGELARFRPAAAEPDGLPLADPVRLVERPDRPRVWCLPTVLATSGPHQYARLAAALGGGWDVSALTLPGYRAGEPLPSTLDALVIALAAAVCRAGQPYALVGYSSGGLLAHALARQLERTGAGPRAVVLLDPYRVGDLPAGLRAAVLDCMVQRLGDLGPADDSRLTAMGGYLRLLEAWQPEPVAAATLVVRAEEPVPGWTGVAEAGDPAAAGAGRVTVPGDHFTLIEEHAATTAKAVAAWLDDIEGGAR